MRNTDDMHYNYWLLVSIHHYDLFGSTVDPGHPRIQG